MLFNRMGIPVPIPRRLNLSECPAFSRDDSMMQTCPGNGTVNGTLDSQFAEFIGVRQFPLDRLVTDMSRRILGCAQKGLFADSGTQISGGSDGAVGDLVGEAFADFTGDAATGGGASGSRDGACAKSSVLDIRR